MTFSDDGKILLGGKEEGSWAFSQAESTLTNPENTSSKLRRLSVQKEQEYRNERRGFHCSTGS